MSVEHEYSIIGHSRSSIGRYLGVVAGLLGSAVGVLLTTLVVYAQKLSFVQDNQVLVIPLSGALFYFIIHFLFDRFFWKISICEKFLNIPNIEGEWVVEGKTVHPEEFNWNSKMTITQKWEKISVFQKTNTSKSHSISASLIKKEGEGYVLMYSYRNEPRLDQPELKPHRGYAEIVFNGDEGEGEYFNSGGRTTFGVMKLKKA